MNFPKKQKKILTIWHNNIRDRYNRYKDDDDNDSDSEDDDDKNFHNDLFLVIEYNEEPCQQKHYMWPQVNRFERFTNP